jgi:hypothetical protein
MASYQNFQNDTNKFSKSPNQFKRVDSSTKERSLDEEWQEKLIDWTTFYRRNIHRFIQHYLGVQLYLYQILWIYLMSIFPRFMSVASRASAKSFLIALYAVAKAILYPGTTIVIMSATKKQAGLIISEKIQGILIPNYPNIAREISKVSSNKTDWDVSFHNGSKIVVVAASDNARGYRSNFNIYEEFRLIDKDTIEKVGTPMLEIRQTPYLKKDEYKQYYEEAEEAYISSGGFKSEWIWTELIKYVNNFFKGKGFCFFGTDYYISIKHAIKSPSQIAGDKDTMSETSFAMEYQNIMIGESEGAYFKYEDFKKNANLKWAFYPYKLNDVIKKEKSKDNIKDKDEVRIIIADIAMAGGQKNDNTIIQCMSLYPSNKGYLRELKYIESLNGLNTEKQVLRLKQIFHDFEADWFVLDIANAGRSIYDLLTKKTIDDMRVRDDGKIIEYDALKITDNTKYQLVSDDIVKDLQNRTLMSNAIPVIIPVNGSIEFNHLVHIEVKKQLNDRKIEFLIEPEKAEDLLYKNKTINGSSTSEEKIFVMQPYLENSELVNESVALESTWVSGKLKLVEPRSGRKDRYMTLGYGNYFASILERCLLKETDNADIKSIMSLMGGSNKNKSLNNIFR